MITYEKGLYLAEVTQQAWQTSKAGNRMLTIVVSPTVQLVLTQDKKEAQVEVSERRSRTIRMAIASENQAEMLAKKLRNAGFTGTKWSEVSLVGSLVRCTVSHEEHRGEAVERWDLELPGYGPLENEPSVAEELDAEFPMTASRAAVASPDEDIPF